MSESDDVIRVAENGMFRRRNGAAHQALVNVMRVGSGRSAVGEGGGERGGGGARELHAARAGRGRQARRLAALRLYVLPHRGEFRKPSEMQLNNTYSFTFVHRRLNKFVILSIQRMPGKDRFYL